LQREFHYTTPKLVKFADKLIVIRDQITSKFGNIKNQPIVNAPKNATIKIADVILKTLRISTGGVTPVSNESNKAILINRK
jgi:hypothetical protein